MIVVIKNILIHFNDPMQNTYDTIHASTVLNGTDTHSIGSAPLVKVGGKYHYIIVSTVVHSLTILLHLNLTTNIHAGTCLKIVIKLMITRIN